MISVDEQLKLLTGLEKLQFGIKSALNNELMSKGNMTIYSQAADISKEIYNTYVALELSKNKTVKYKKKVKKLDLKLKNLMKVFKDNA